MSTDQAKRIVKLYSQELKKNQVPFLAIYLFGSYSTGKNSKWSDIDVLVVTDKIKNYSSYKEKLWQGIVGIDSRLEPHICEKKDFIAGNSPIAVAVKKTGIKIT